MEILFFNFIFILKSINKLKEKQDNENSVKLLNCHVFCLNFFQFNFFFVFKEIFKNHCFCYDKKCNLCSVNKSPSGY